VILKSLIYNNFIGRRSVMAVIRFKEKHMGVPIEKHDTAAWANIEKTKPVSNVTIPSEEQVDNARDHVDVNEK
jgi:hypothetical protein